MQRSISESVTAGEPAVPDASDVTAGGAAHRPLIKRLQKAVIVTISAVAIVAAILYAGPVESLRQLAGIHLGWVGVAGLAMLAGVCFSVLRFRSVLRAFGHVPDIRTLLTAFLVGQVSNAFLLNVVGQSVTRAGVLTAAGVPYGVTVASTFWERLQAAGLLFVGALAGALYLVSSLSLDLAAGGIEFIWLMSGLGAATVAALWAALRILRPRAPLRHTLETLSDLGPSLLLTVVIHGCTLLAWFAVLYGVADIAVSGAVFCALLIVMFASSVPISMSGWGLRELTAAHALGFLGIAPSSAVAAALAVGGVSLALVALSGALAAALARHPREVPAAHIGAAGPLSRLDTATTLPMVGVLVTALLVFFQVPLPTGESEITVNLADPAAIIAGGLLLLHILMRRDLGPIPQSLAVWLLALTAVIGLALVVGWFRYGLNDWAIWNRGVGWLILLGYVAAGAGVIYVGGRRQLAVVFGGLIAAGIALILFQTGAFLLVSFWRDALGDIDVMPFFGFAGNPNAYAVQLVGLLAIGAAGRRAGLFGQRLFPFILVTGILVAGMYLTFSRTGYGMFTVAFCLMILAAPRGQGLIETGRILAGVLLGAVIVATVYWLPDLVAAFSTVSNALLQAITGEGTVTSASDSARLAAQELTRGHMGNARSDAERWLSLVQGWELWIQHPFLGSGLGAQVQRYVIADETPLVIHCTPLWLLAETGVFGLVVALGGLIALVAWVWRILAEAKDGDSTRAPWALGAAILVVCVGSAGLFHDLAYQRMFWFLIGLFLALALTRPDLAERNTGKASAAPRGDADSWR